MICIVISVEKQNITITNFNRTSRDPMKYVIKKWNKKEAQNNYISFSPQALSVVKSWKYNEGIADIWQIIMKIHVVNLLIHLMKGQWLRDQVVGSFRHHGTKVGEGHYRLLVRGAPWSRDVLIIVQEKFNLWQNSIFTKNSYQHKKEQARNESFALP